MLKIREAFKRDEFILVIIYGPLRWGKSALAMQVLAELYGTWNYEILKNYIGFHPAKVLKQWVAFSGKKQLAYCWDDAGLWLHALDWNSPFVKATGRYLNVAGTDWGGLILTTPLPTWISKKIRGIPQAITVKVRKTSGNQPDHREGIAYRFWTAPDMKHSGVHKIFIEKFTRMMPNEFYSWYKPLRDSYAKLAKQLMAKELKTLPEDLEQEITRKAPPIVQVA